MDDLRSRAVRGVSWSALQRLGSQAVQGVVFLWLARLLEPAAFGLLSLALIYVTFLQIFVEQGAGDAVVQQTELEPGFVDTAFWANLLGGLIFGVAGWLAADGVAALFGQPELARLLRALSPLFVLNALTVVPLSLLRRELRFKALAACSLWQNVGGGLAAVWMATRGAGVWSLVGQQFAATSTGLVALFFLSPWRPRLVWNGACFRRLAWFGGNVCGVNLLNLFNRQADNLIIGYFLGPVALGYYAVAYQILVNLANLFVGTINSVALPLFARLQGDRPRFHKTVLRLTALTCLLSAPVFYGVTALGPEILAFGFGAKWLGSAACLQVLCLVGLLYAGFYFHGPILTALGKPQWNLFLNAWQAGGNAVAFLVGVHWGIVGVATAYVARAYLMAPIHLWVLRRQVGVEAGAYLAQFFPAGLASGAMTVAVLAAKHVCPPTWPLGVTLALCVLAGGVVYTVTALAADADLRARAQGLLGRLRKPADPILSPHEAAR